MNIRKITIRFRRNEKGNVYIYIYLLNYSKFIDIKVKLSKSTFNYFSCKTDTC